MSNLKSLNFLDKLSKSYWKKSLQIALEFLKNLNLNKIYDRASNHTTMICSKTVNVSLKTLMLILIGIIKSL